MRKIKEVLSLVTLNQNTLSIQISQIMEQLKEIFGTSIYDQLEELQDSIESIEQESNSEMCEICQENNLYEISKSLFIQCGTCEYIGGEDES